MNNVLKTIRMREFEMNAKEFAEYLDVEYSTYRGWEKGRSQPPLEVAQVNEDLSNIKDMVLSC
jgi:DNA-binding transcriptional regulator YiaG